MRLAFACRGQTRSVTICTLHLLGEAKALCPILSATSPFPLGQTFFTMALTGLVGRTTPTQAFRLAALFGYLFSAGRDLLCRNQNNTPLSSDCLRWALSFSAATFKRNAKQAAKKIDSCEGSHFAKIFSKRPRFQPQSNRERRKRKRPA